MGKISRPTATTTTGGFINQPQGKFEPIVPVPMTPESCTMITKSKTHFSTKRRGFTLAESLMAVVVLGIAAAGVLLPFTGGARVRAEGVRRTLAVKLASDLTEEIINTPFDEVLATYGDYSESQGQVKDADGVVFTDANYANYSRNAGCEMVYVSQESGDEDAIFILATVRVYYSGRLIATVNRLISK
jgi:prepilin-type N-terminal cleavage/methylation domain-containing protein